MHENFALSGKKVTIILTKGWHAIQSLAPSCKSIQMTNHERWSNTIGGGGQVILSMNIEHKINSKKFVTIYHFAIQPGEMNELNFFLKMNMTREWIISFITFFVSYSMYKRKLELLSLWQKVYKLKLKSYSNNCFGGY